MSKRVSVSLILYTALAIACTALSTDSFLPALSLMAANLSVSEDDIKLVVPTFFMGLGLGHLLWGSYSDRFGRKPALAFGFLLFTLANILSALAPSLDVLLISRVLQGFGAASGYLVARAVLRDVAEGPALVKALAYTGMIFAFVPLVAPLIGFSIMTIIGWRAIFWATAGLGLIMLAWTSFGFQETNRYKGKAFSLSEMLKSIKIILAHKQSGWFILVNMVVYVLLISMITNTAIVFEAEFNITGYTFAVIFGITGITIFIGQHFNTWMMTHKSIRFALRFSSLALTILGIIWVGIGSMDAFTPVLLAACMLGFFLFFVMIFTNALALVLDPHPERAGLAAALTGLTSMISGAILNTILASYIAGSALALGIQVLCFSSLTALLIWIWREQTEIPL